MLADVIVFHQFLSGNKWNPLLKHVKWADFLNLIYCFIIIMCSYILVKSCRTSCLSLLEPTPVIVTWIDWKHFYPCQMGCKFIAGYSLPCPALPPSPCLQHFVNFVIAAFVNNNNLNSFLSNLHKTTYNWKWNFKTGCLEYITIRVCQFRQSTIFLMKGVSFKRNCDTVSVGILQDNFDLSN